jgi:thioredoxin-like negative regulator of GroEL
MLAIVADAGPLRDDARLAMIDIFGVLGNDHPLTQTYRRRLATTLY